MPDTTESHDKKRSFETFDVTVGKTEEITPRVRNIRFDYISGKSMSFHSGQFVQIFVPTNDDKPLRRSYSIASSPFDDRFFELCVTLVEGGKSSNFLHHLNVGDKVKAMGPLGKFTLPDPIPNDIVFVATGSGIAPFRSMIKDLVKKGVKKDIYLVFGNRFIEDIIYRKEWEDLARSNPNFHVQFNLSKPQPEWKGKKGYVQDMISDFIPNPQKKDFYICGLTKMIEAVTEKLGTLGVPTTQIHFERYD